MTKQAPPQSLELADWVRWLEALDPSKIEMGLERTTQVLEQMGLRTPSVPVITVAGTNGKGSTVAYLQSIFAEAGLRCGSTTSPHLFSVNERIAINGQAIDDWGLVSCLQAVENGRGDIPLTYFEFLVVAALLWFQKQAVDVIVLEVGLGGRLDATNCIDSDIAIVTSIGVDHQAWLGSDVERIAEEKAAICRPNKPLILASSDIPLSADNLARQRDALVFRESSDYQVVDSSDGISVSYKGRQISAGPRGLASVPVTNAGAAMLAASLLSDDLEISAAAIARGISSAKALGRGQKLTVEWHGAKIEVVVDVAHNPDSAYCLQLALGKQFLGENLPVALCAMLGDKDGESVFQQLQHSFSAWNLAGLGGPRGQTAEALAEKMGIGGASCYRDVEGALPLVLNQMLKDNQKSLVIFGSFETVASALTWCRQYESPTT